MAVFRIERTRDYTVMSNHHLRNHELSLKAKGLLSMMLSLPDDWNYTTRGLAKICKEGVDAIGNALRELETAGYIVRHQLRDRQGRISDTEYVIYEKPQPRQPETPRPDTAVPDTASPDTENPYLDKPDTEKPAELNIEKSNTQKSITQGASTDSIPFREPAAAQLPERKGRDAMSVSEIENYRELILENIEYDYLCREFSTYREDLYEIVESEYMKYEKGTKSLFTEDLLRELCLGLNSMCVGAESKFFNGHTNISDDRFICFGVKGLMEANKKLKDAMLFNILSFMNHKLLTKGNTAAFGSGDITVLDDPAF